MREKFGNESRAASGRADPATARRSRSPGLAVAWVEAVERLPYWRLPPRLRVQEQRVLTYFTLLRTAAADD